MTTADSITVTTVVAVDPMAAFSVFTDEIEAWWKPKVKNLLRKEQQGRLKFEPGVGGRVLEVYADPREKPLEVGRILIWEPARRLAFEWRQENFQPNEVTQIEVRFEAAPGGTRVTLEHRGWDALPDGHPARHGLSGDSFTGMIGLRWADALTAFRALAADARN